MSVSSVLGKHLFQFAVARAKLLILLLGRFQSGAIQMSRLPSGQVTFKSSAFGCVNYFQPTRSYFS